MDQSKHTSNGRLMISKKVLNKMASECINEIEGIEGLSPLPFNLKKYILTAKKPNEINIKIVDGTIFLELGLVVKEGRSVLKLCEECQKQIKDTMQSMTGFTVSRIDIYVNDVNAKKEIA